MAEFFEKMGRLNRAMRRRAAGIPAHPSSLRQPDLRRPRNRAQNMPVPEPSDGRDFYLVQARLRAMTAKTPDEALEWFNHRMDRADTNQAESDALFYGRAIAHQKKGEYEEARKLLQSLIDREHHIAYDLQMADLDLESGRDNQAIDLMAGLYNSFPGNHAISLQYAQALLKGQDVRQAKTAAVLLRKQLLTHPNDPLLFELYARSANIAGNSIRAKEAIAESYYLRGSTHEAAMQLQALAGSEDLDYYQRARITARITELRMELAKLGLDEN